MSFEFSLVITTYNRFDKFLHKYINGYLNNKYISEIVISDDFSDDYAKLMAKYSSNPKVKIVQQPRNLGALRNKISACTHATKEWICLMDSDNYCNSSYFDGLVKYWMANPSDKTVVYSPVKAHPRFNFSEYIGTVINQKNWNTIDQCLTNLGNNVFHKSIVDHLLPILSETIEVYGVDVKYMNYKLFNKGISIIVVQGMEYDHCIHQDSLYSKTLHESGKFNTSFDWATPN
jgi:glycosyltransferase involved in cell wall biosynthesis